MSGAAGTSGTGQKGIENTALKIGSRPVPAGQFRRGQAGRDRPRGIRGMRIRRGT
jgi:hypothetical protein